MAAMRSIEAEVEVEKDGYIGGVLLLRSDFICLILLPCFLF